MAVIDSEVTLGIKENTNRKNCMRSRCVVVYFPGRCWHLIDPRRLSGCMNRLAGLWIARALTNVMLNSLVSEQCGVLIMMMMSLMVMIVVLCFGFCFLFFFSVSFNHRSLTGQLYVCHCCSWGWKTTTVINSSMSFCLRCLSCLKGLCTLEGHVIIMILLTQCCFCPEEMR